MHNQYVGKRFNVDSSYMRGRLTRTFHLQSAPDDIGLLHFVAIKKSEKPKLNQTDQV